MQRPVLLVKPAAEAILHLSEGPNSTLSAGQYFSDL